MDIHSLLPLLLRKSGGGNERMNTLLKLAQTGEKPDIGTVMDMAMTQKRKSPPKGLSPIAEIASAAILGNLVKHFSLA